jgi:hypothetical protein
MAECQNLNRVFRDPLRKPRLAVTPLTPLMQPQQRHFQAACSQPFWMLPDRRRAALPRYLCAHFAVRLQCSGDEIMLPATNPLAHMLHASTCDNMNVAVCRTRNCDAQRPEMQRQDASPGTARTSWPPRRRRPLPRLRPQLQGPSQPPLQVIAVWSRLLVQTEMYLLTL